MIWGFMSMSDKFTWVTNTREKPDSVINCKNCDGVILFSRIEIERNKREGKNTSTPCRYCDYHPSYPPEPFHEINNELIKHLGYNKQWDESH